jgi:hypothetical protein
VTHLALDCDWADAIASDPEVRHALIPKAQLDQLIERQLTTNPKAAARRHRTLADTEAVQFAFSSSMGFFR